MQLSTQKYVVLRCMLMTGEVGKRSIPDFYTTIKRAMKGPP